MSVHFVLATDIHNLVLVTKITGDGFWRLGVKLDISFRELLPVCEQLLYEYTGLRSAQMWLLPSYFCSGEQVRVCLGFCQHLVREFTQGEMSVKWVTLEEAFLLLRKTIDLVLLGRILPYFNTYELNFNLLGGFKC